MPKFSVHLNAITNMTAFVEVEAEDAKAAFMAVLNRKKGSPVAEAVDQAAWEFVDARDAFEVEPTSVWDEGDEGEVWPGEAPKEGKRFVAVRSCDAFVHYRAIIDGHDLDISTPQEAWDYVHDAENGELPWIKSSTSEYDGSELSIQDEDGNDLIEPQEE